MEIEEEDEVEEEEEEDEEVRVSSRFSCSMAEVSWEHPLSADLESALAAPGSGSAAEQRENQWR